MMKRIDSIEQMGKVRGGFFDSIQSMNSSIVDTLLCSTKDFDVRRSCK